jgi:hypothetical protein
VHGIDAERERERDLYKDFVFRMEGDGKIGR